MEDIVIIVLDFFSEPFVIGLTIGLIVALIVRLRALARAREARIDAQGKLDQLKDQVATLKTHLQTQMEITAKGSESLKDEITAQQKTNQNLNETIAALKQKPGRAEIRTLHLYEKAIRIMNARAPGFGSPWESAVQEAEAEIQKEESGVIGWMRRPFMFRKGPTEPITIESTDATEPE